MSNPIVTGNVTGFLESVFHPEWSYSSMSGFMLQVNTSLDGNVTIGDTSTNYTLYLNGTQITGSGQGVVSLNQLFGGLTISTTTVADISIYTSGASTIYVDYIGTGGTAGVTTLSGLTGNISLSSGVGIDISVNTNTSQILFINRGVVGLCDGITTLSGTIGLVGDGVTITLCDVTNTITLSANGGGAGPIVNVCDWAVYRANQAVNLCGQSIYDSSGSVITLSGTVHVADALSVVGQIVSLCGDLTITSGNIATASGSLVATSAAFGSNVVAGNNVVASNNIVASNNLGVSNNLTVGGQAYINLLQTYVSNPFTVEISEGNLVTASNFQLSSGYVYRFSTGVFTPSYTSIQRHSIFLALSEIAGGANPEYPIVDRTNISTGAATNLCDAPIGWYYGEYSTIFPCPTPYSNVLLVSYTCNVLAATASDYYFKNIAIERLRSI